MRKLVLMLAVAGLLSAALYAGWQWQHEWRFVEKTDNAYVHADISVISPTVPGYVDSVRVADNQLVKAGDVTYTWKVKDKALHKVNLRIGARDVRTGQWEVQSGLVSGDTVLRTPGSTFKDGQKVELTAGKAVPAAAVASSSTAVAGKGN